MSSVFLNSVLQSLLRCSGTLVSSRTLLLRAGSLLLVLLSWASLGSVVSLDVVLEADVVVEAPLTLLALEGSLACVEAHV